MKRCVQVLNEALHELFAERDDVVPARRGRARPVRRRVQGHAGALRRATPTACSRRRSREASLFGVAAGMALRGQRPILEIMFGDFIALGIDQIVNGIAKFREMYDDQVTVPLVVRTPMGGRRGYGPTHSQSLEKLLLGVPNIVVVAASECHDLRGLLVERGRGRAPGVLRREQAHVRPAEPSARGRAHRRSSPCARPATRYPALTFSGDRLLRGRRRRRHLRRDAPRRARRRRPSSILEHEIFCEVVALSQLAADGARARCSSRSRARARS